MAEWLCSQQQFGSRDMVADITGPDQEEQVRMSWTCCSWGSAAAAVTRPGSGPALPETSAASLL